MISSLISQEKFPYLWKKIHNQVRLSASKIPDALGVGYITKKKLHDIKCKVVPKKAHETSFIHKMQMYGIRNESKAISMFLKLPYVEKKEKNIVPLRTGFWFYAKDTNYGFTPDLICIGRNNDQVRCFGLEIKCPYIKTENTTKTLPKINHVIQSIACMEMSLVAQYWYLFYWYPEEEKCKLFKIKTNREFWEKDLFPLIKKASEDIHNPNIPPKLLLVSAKEKKHINDLIFENYEIKQINIL